MINLKDDFILATNARQNACSKYSNYTVGAVLTCKNGRKYTGCNIENNGIQSICAERVAFCKALSEGERYFSYITIIGGFKDKEAEKCVPCGYCRQFMNEFVDEDFKVYNIYENKVDEYTMENLLPNSFNM